MQHVTEGMDGPMKHETSARCRASRSVKQSTVWWIRDRDVPHENISASLCVPSGFWVIASCLMSWATETLITALNKSN